MTNTEAGGLKQTHRVTLPPNHEFPLGYELDLKERVLVVIGANGAGKTRFGAWLNTRLGTSAHRISAHRALSFPEKIQPTDLLEAEKLLLVGDERAYKGLRWNDKPETILLNDYAALMTYLVSDRFVACDEYTAAMGRTNTRLDPPITKLDLVRHIWEAVLPTRELVISGSRFEARNRSSAERYHAQEMSDGERGVFYLIGEALSVPPRGVFIIDEPELHLHRAIQSRLWDAIEAARPDCMFVYITHDLGFAASRKDATKLWLKEYTTGKWDWELVSDTDDLPEPLLLEVMGSRFPVIFVEGDRSSLDYFIYSRLFQSHTIVPCGSCEAVAHSTKSFRERQEIHHHRCMGIVDADVRANEDVVLLGQGGVQVLPVAIIENLLLTEPVLRAAAIRLALPVSETLQRIQSRIFSALQQNRDKLVSLLVRREIHKTLGRIGLASGGIEEVEQAYGDAVSSLNPRVLFGKWNAELDRVITDQDYPAALKYYCLKGLPFEVDPVFNSGYVEQMRRWLRGNDADDLLNAMRSVLPWVDNMG
jgi:hypothetical protein